MLLVLILILTLLYFLYKHFISYPRPKNFPPGPDGLPIIGAAMEFSKLDPVVHVAMTMMGEKYGPICGIYLGKKPCLLINGWERVKEVLMRDEFQSRPHLEGSVKKANGHPLGIMFSNGEFWKGQRRFTMRQLRDCGFGKTSIESMIQEEISECISELKTRIGENEDSTTWVHDAFGVSIINILWSVTAGNRFSHNDAKFKNLLDKINAAFRSGSMILNVVNDWPFLKYAPVISTAYQKSLSTTKELDKLLEDSITEHQKTRLAESPRDFIDMYLNEMETTSEKENKQSPFFKAQLIQLISDLFGAGAESTSNSVAFGILYMMLHPEIQNKVQEELDTVIGFNRVPSFTDKLNLPYTESVMNELLRVSNIAPLTVPHMTSQDTKLGGYDIPKDTSIVVNLYSVHMDKEYWKDPEHFRPERFMDSNGALIKYERLIPFGIGKRNCPGESLARMNYFLFFATLLQTFRFEVAPGTEKPSTVPLPGFTVAPQPFKAKLTLRNDH